MASATAIEPGKKRDTRQGFLTRYAGLIAERQSWILHWREIAEFVIPRRQRFLYDDKNRGDKVNQKIINGTATRALRINSSGMMTGICSPARPWFRLTTSDPDLIGAEGVREWLDAVVKAIHLIFNRSNFYNAVPMVFRDLAAFGTAAQCMEEDDRDTIRCYVYPIGSYVLASSARQEIDTIYREVGMTVGQIGEKWGIDNVKASSQLMQAWKENRHDDWIRILHVIEPNQNYTPGRADRAGKKWRSVWIEMSSGDSDAPPLYEGNGFNEFPAMCPRWDVTGEDTYGSSPAMDALGDIKALQQIERRKLNAIDKIVNPPMVGPTSLKNARTSLLSGDMTYNDSGPGGQKFEPAITVDSKVVLLREEILLHEKRINEAFLVDIFMMLSQYGTVQPPTKRQVDEQHEEKMLQLGAFFQRFHDEFLDPSVERVFAIGVRRGLFPDPPIALQGAELMVEPVSIMETLQKMMGTTGVERFFGFLATQTNFDPAAVDKVDIDKSIDNYADMVSLPPDILSSASEVEAKRAARAKQAAAAALAASADPALKGAKAAESLSRTGVDVGNVAAGLAGQPLNQGYI